MPFNSQSYYRNKAKRQALDYLAEARAMKWRLDAGKPGLLDDFIRLGRLVGLARSQWKIYRGYLNMDRCDADLKRLQRGEISHAEFMSKWDPRK